MTPLRASMKTLLVIAMIGIVMMTGLIGSVANAAPAPFIDDNFYNNCVKATYVYDFPNDTIPATGLTDEQLAKITRLACMPLLDTGSAIPPSTMITGDITNFAGLERLINLKNLTLGSYRISNINLDTNTKLEHLSLYGNDILFIDLSGNPNLITLDLSHNFKLLSLDLTNNKKITSLDIHGTNIDILDISSNPNLVNLYADDNIILNTGTTCDPIKNNTTICDLISVGNLIGQGNMYEILNANYYNYEASAGVVKFSDVAAAVKDITPPTDEYLFVVAETNSGVFQGLPSRVFLRFNMPSNYQPAPSPAPTPEPSPAKAPNTGAITSDSAITIISFNYLFPILAGFSMLLTILFKLNKYNKIKSRVRNFGA